jgi:predicted  nucleic acid-binding Zn-ribbon protein
METTITSLPETMRKLLELQALQRRDEQPSAQELARIAELNAQVPRPILDHFNRLLAHGKKGVALVRNGVCAECHIKISSGSWAALVHGTDIQICGNCGRYLYLPPGAASSDEGPLKSETRPAAPKKRTRKAALVGAS